MKELDLYLRKIQISFMVFEKFRFTSKEDVMISRFLKLKIKIMTIKTLRKYFNKILTTHDMSIWKLKLKTIYSCITKLKETEEKKK